MTSVSNKDKFSPGQLVRLYPPKGYLGRTSGDFISLKSTVPMHPRKYVPKGTVVMFLRYGGGGDHALVLFEENVWLAKMRFMRPCKRPRKAYDNVNHS